MALARIISCSKLDTNLLSRYCSSVMQFSVAQAIGVQFPAMQQRQLYLSSHYLDDKVPRVNNLANQ
jgi:hypothetical protein